MSTWDVYTISQHNSAWESATFRSMNPHGRRQQAVGKPTLVLKDDTWGYSWRENCCYHKTSTAAAWNQKHSSYQKAHIKNSPASNSHINWLRCPFNSSMDDYRIAGNFWGRKPRFSRFLSRLQKFSRGRWAFVRQDKQSKKVFSQNVSLPPNCESFLPRKFPAKWYLVVQWGCLIGLLLSVPMLSWTAFQYLVTHTPKQRSVLTHHWCMYTKYHVLNINSNHYERDNAITRKTNCWSIQIWQNGESVDGLCGGNCHPNIPLHFREMIFHLYH